MSTSAKTRDFVNLELVKIQMETSSVIVWKDTKLSMMENVAKVNV